MLRGTTRYYEWYWESARGTASGATRYYEMYYESLWGTTSGLRYYEWDYESLRGITRGLRCDEWSFRSTTKSQLNQLGAMLFMISYDLLRIICFYPESNVDYSKKLRLGYNFLKLAGLTQNSGSCFFKRIQGFISEA